MYALKEKFTDKLSQLLGDSPSQSPDSPQAHPSPKGANTFSSIFSFGHPSTNTKKTEEDAKPKQSRLTRWSSKGRASWRSKHIDSQAEGLQVAAPEERETPVPARNTFASEVFEDAVEPEGPWKLMPNLTEESTFIYGELYEFLQSSIPNIVKGCQWVLLYSTLKHGISLRTLIRKSADISGPGVLIVGDRKGAVFGGLLDCPLKPCPKRKYQGTNQSFVFTTKYGQPRLFRATGANRYFHLCLSDLLAFGGGGNFALSMDGDLLTGSSGACETFGNSCLAHDSEFELKNVELWGFTYSSRYLT